MENLNIEGTWITLYQKKSVSPSGNYRLSIERKRLKFTNLIATLGTVYEEKTGKSVLEIDLQQDPKNFWSTWLQIPVFLPDSNETYPSSGRIEYKEYLLTSGKNSGAVLISILDNTSIEISTPYEWKDAKLSPQGDKLAITCKFDKVESKPIRVFDFRNPQSPPYPEIQISHFPDIRGMKKYHSEIEWIDDASIKVELPVYCGDDELALGYDYYTEDIILHIKNPISGMSQLRSIQKY